MLEYRQTAEIRGEMLSRAWKMVDFQCLESIEHVISSCKKLCSSPNSLDLGRSNIDASILHGAPQHSSSLHAVNLSHHKLGYEKVAFLAHALSCCNNLKVLNLSHNNIDV